MLNIAYTIGFGMVIITGYLILKYHFEFKRVKVKTRKCLLKKRKENRVKLRFKKK